MPVDLAIDDYRRLADFRYILRRFLQFSERNAREHGLEPQQHQALLALKGLAPGVPPTVREIAARLLLKHHSAVELMNRLEAAGLVRRSADPGDARRILLRLTVKGAARLRSLSVAHREELRVKGPELLGALRAILSKRGDARSK